MVEYKKELTASVQTTASLSYAATLYRIVTEHPLALLFASAGIILGAFLTKGFSGWTNFWMSIVFGYLWLFLGIQLRKLLS